MASGSLQIDSVTEADVGVYQCRAENTEDSADVTAQLEVQVPPRYVVRPRSLVAHEKDDAEMECQLYGRPEPTVQWTKNGELIIESEYFQVKPNEFIQLNLYLNLFPQNRSSTATTSKSSAWWRLISAFISASDPMRPATFRPPPV